MLGVGETVCKDLNRHNSVVSEYHMKKLMYVCMLGVLIALAAGSFILKFNIFPALSSHCSIQVNVTRYKNNIKNK